MHYICRHTFNPEQGAGAAVATHPKNCTGAYPDTSLFITPETVMTRKELTKVLPRDFDAAALLQAAREGRLYLQARPQDEQQQRREAEAEIMSYVAHIHPCAAPPYARTVEALWRRIVQHPLMVPALYLQKGSRKGRPNLYFVTAVALYLHNRGVYRTELSAVHLHLCMEQSTRRSPIYTSATHYWPDKAQAQALAHLAKELEQKNEE